MGRPPKEPTEVIGIRLPVAQIERLDKLLADKRFKWSAAGVHNRTDLIRFLLNEGVETQEAKRSR